MGLSVEEIETEILHLSALEQQRLVAFIEKLRLQKVNSQSKVEATSCNDTKAVEQAETEGARILRILKNEGLLGCMNKGDPNLSVNYKQHLWTDK